jgi:mono/diheme cytochrome c family protein
VNKKIFVSVFGLVSLLPILSCSEQNQPESGIAGAQTNKILPSETVVRWYSSEQVLRGGALFQQHCAECHKADASGTPDWKKTDAEGKLPPPPLNGTAHAWHHPLPMLQQIVRNGGIPMGGSMPAFKGKLNDRQINDILAWVQSHWPDKQYTTWSQINQRSYK